MYSNLPDSIDFDEFSSLVDGLGAIPDEDGGSKPVGLTYGQKKRIFEELDLNEDGELQTDEFILWFTRENLENKNSVKLRKLITKNHDLQKLKPGEVQFDATAIVEAYERFGEFEITISLEISVMYLFGTPGIVNVPPTCTSAVLLYPQTENTMHRPRRRRFD